MRKALWLLAFAFIGAWPLCGQETAPANSILVIEPYRHAGTWVFDDKEAGLRKEPFVAGAPEIIDKMVKDIPNADRGFRLLFSSQEFPGASHKLLWRRGDKGGNWYYSAEYKMEGWLCPSLFKYFQQVPKVIHVKVEPNRKEEKKE